MAAFSVWEFSKFQSLDNIMEVIKENISQAIEVDDAWPYAKPLIAFREYQKDGEIYSVNTKKSINVNGTNIDYILVSAIWERVKRQNSWIENGHTKLREDLITEFNKRLLIFAYNNTVYGIMYSTKNVAEQIINNLFKDVEVWGSVSNKNFGITEDLLYWIFYRVKDFPDDALVRNEDIYIPALHGYAGKTKDKVNDVKGSGSRIVAMLGTIAFLFNDESLKTVSPEVKIKENQFRIELSLEGTYRVWESKTSLGNLNVEDELLYLIKLSIFSTLDLIPKLIECFNKNTEVGKWSSNIKLSFLSSLGSEIQNRVTAELSRLEIQIARENGIDDIEDDAEDLLDCDDE